MYLGHVMEQGTTDEIFSPPYHPYTEALLSAVPIADTSVIKKHIVLTGELPSPMNPPSGCPFQTRCPRKIGPICETEMPAVKELSPGHRILCHLDEATLKAMEPVIALAESGKAKKAPARKAASTSAKATTKASSRKPARQGAARQQDQGLRRDQRRESLGSGLISRNSFLRMARAKPV